MKSCGSLSAIAGTNSVCVLKGHEDSFDCRSIANQFLFQSTQKTCWMGENLLSCIKQQVPPGWFDPPLATACVEMNINDDRDESSRNEFFRCVRCSRTSTIVSTCASTVTSGGKEKELTINGSSLDTRNPRSRIILASAPIPPPKSRILSLRNFEKNRKGIKTFEISNARSRRPESKSLIALE
jgi:hypothetical protein